MSRPKPPKNPDVITAKVVQQVTLSFTRGLIIQALEKHFKEAYPDLITSDMKVEFAFTVTGEDYLEGGDLVATRELTP